MAQISIKFSVEELVIVCEEELLLAITYPDTNLCHGIVTMKAVYTVDKQK